MVLADASGYLRFLCCDDLVDDLPVHIGQAEIATGVPERQAFVVEAKQMQDGGVQIVHVNFALNRSIAVFVRRAMHDPSFHTAPDKESGEAVGIVSATIIVHRGTTAR